jgi:PhnB protein
MAFGANPPPIQAHICVKGGLEAIAFYKKAFSAECPFHQLAEDGKRVKHANIESFGSEVMRHDEFPEFGGDVLSPSSRGGASVTINVNLPKPAAVDTALDRARSAGAEVVMAAQDVFWGARYGRVRDPFGHVWAFNAPLRENAA